jgi:lantibiotic modifying enzyme
LPEWEAQLRLAAAAWLESIAQHGWRCGTPLNVETPGLLTGLAGIGWQLLRLAEPERVPAVLLFEVPRQFGMEK